LLKIWETAQEILTTEEKIKLFLGKYLFGRTSWHIAS
jgi:hypothetical protein